MAPGETGVTRDPTQPEDGLSVSTSTHCVFRVSPFLFGETHKVSLEQPMGPYHPSILCLSHFTPFGL